MVRILKQNLKYYKTLMMTQWLYLRTTQVRPFDEYKIFERWPRNGDLADPNFWKISINTLFGKKFILLHCIWLSCTISIITIFRGKAHPNRLIPRKMSISTIFWGFILTESCEIRNKHFFKFNLWLCSESCDYHKFFFEF